MSKTTKPETEEEKAKDEVVLKLIRLIDDNRAIIPKKYDGYRGSLSTVVLSGFSLIVIFWFGLFVYTLVTPTSLLERILAFLTLGNFVVAFFAFVLLRIERSVVDVCFERLETCHGVENSEKPLLKALIKMRIRHQEFNLMDVYNIENSLFTRYELLRFLYAKT